MHQTLICLKYFIIFIAAYQSERKIKSEIESMFTALLEQFPNYFNLPVDNDWDETIQRIVKKNTEKID